MFSWSVGKITLVNNSFLKKKIIITSKFLRLNSTDANTLENKKPERVFFKNPEYDKDGFRIFDPYMNKPGRGFRIGQLERKKSNRMQKDNFARANQMSVDQDWTQAWPANSMFKQCAVPLPVRQGFIKNSSENNGLPPEKYGNCELIKIPNFLHLTPPHIEKHCKAIKEWPKELDEKMQKKYFPIEITTSTYIYDGPNIRDDRARKVTLEINIDSLNLEERAKAKLIKLAQHRYNSDTGILSINTNRCPYRKQNVEYATYLLTTLYYEAKQFEEWEKEIQEQDIINYSWVNQNKKIDLSRQSLASQVEESEIEMKKNIKEKSNIDIDYQLKRKELLTNETNINILSYKKTVLNLLNLK